MNVGSSLRGRLASWLGGWLSRRAEVGGLEVAVLMGLVLLLLYGLSAAFRGIVQAPLWHLEGLVAGFLAVKLPSSPPVASGGLEWPALLLVLVAYSLVSIYLIRRRSRPLPSEEDMLARYEPRPPKPRMGEVNR